MARLHLLAAIILTAISSVSCAVYTNPRSVRKTQYDFIVIGAGTGGNVIATRLSENPSISVLLIEAGVEPDVDVDDEVPFMATTLAPNTSITWNYTTTPQAALNDRTVPYPRGRVLGGSSTINYMFFTRGSEDDWNRYAAVSGDEGWSFSNIVNYAKRSEHLVASTDGHNTTGEVDPSIHGYSGPVQITVANYPSPIDDLILASSQQFPDVFPYNEDMNSGKPLGLGWSQSSIDSNGRRSSSATAYLSPALNRTNLDLLMLTTATKLIPTGEKNGLPVFTSVEVAQAPGAPSRVFSANKEIILSAGATNTPQLLMLSGIGNPSELKKVGITPIVDLPGVGQNLQDHPLITVHWLVNSNNTLQTIERNTTLIDELYEEWDTTGTGPFTDFGVNQIAWLRMPDNYTFQNGDPSAGPNSPHIELLPGNGYVGFTGAPTPATGSYLSVVLAVISPVARGSVTLASSNPFDSPLINPSLLGSSDDVAVMLQAVKDAQKLVSNSAFDGYIISPVDPSPGATDAEIEDFIRQQTTTIFHPVGTAPMGNGTGASVLTSQLTVRGTSGLRVVDASVVPYIPSSHPQAVVYAIAERTSDLIKEKWNL